MSVSGIGIDIEEIGRITGVLERWQDRFKHRVFTPAECEYCESRRRPYQHYAARFAAKEAFAKAIGLGWSGFFRWKDVEVHRSGTGQPMIILHNELAKLVASSTILLSLSHSPAYAAAVVIIESSDS